MKICIVMPNHWSGALGGAELQVRYFVDHLQRNSRHQLSMICRLSAMSDEGGMPIYLTSAPKILKRYTQLGEWTSIDRQLRWLSPDVVYTRTSGAYVGFVARYCQKYGKRHVHHIAHIEDVQPGRLLRKRSFFGTLERPWYEYGLKRAHSIVVQAEYQARLLEKNFRRHCSAIVPNYHPVPPDVHKDNSKKLVLWVSNLKPAKQPEAFIELARSCSRKTGARFVMVGAVQARQYGRASFWGGTNGTVEYLGPRSIEEVNRLLGDAHVFVNTSMESGEGFPNTFIQAWLRRVPVVSLHVNPDQMLDGRCLGVCCDGSMERLQQAVAEILGNEQGRAVMGAEARSLAMARFGIGNFVRLQEILESAKADQ